MNNKTPKKAQTYQVPSSKRSTMLGRTGEDSKAAGLAVKVSKREGRRKRPTTHAIQRREQESKQGLCDGNAGGGQGQMPMESSLEMQPPAAHSIHLVLEGQ